MLELEPIAIIGISALFPGSADAPAYWRNIVEKTDLVTDVPETHWLTSDYYDPDPQARDKTYCKRGAFLPKSSFDPLKYGIPPANLAATDATQLLALMLAEKVLDDAVQGKFQHVERSRTGVILGVTGTTELTAHMSARMGHPHWAQALRDGGLPPAQVEDLCERIAACFIPWQENTFPGLLGNVVAGRIANRFDLGGTNCIVDAACASSLAALSMAVNELRLGQADMIIAGGADTLNDPLMFLCFSKTPALSPTGDCRPFSDNADGTILGEGIGMLALRRLSDAERDGDQIYAVIRGVGSSSDGRSKSIYAPRAEGQVQALQRAYQAAGYSPSTVELVEAHGTGTAVGDRAEFDALRAVFAEADSDRRQWCALGSVKSQIGHTKAAAGVAGMLKAVLALHHKVLPATIKADQPHPDLNLGESSFYLSTQTRPWIRSSAAPRRASVSSFGFGGSNFHIALEEYVGPVPRPGRFRTSPTETVLLSAPSRRELSERCTSLSVEFLKSDDAGTFDSTGFQARARMSQLEFDSSAPFRLAAIGTDAADVGEKLNRAVESLAQTEVESYSNPQGLYFDGPRSPAKVAFIFSGQGGQYVGMGQDLAMTFSAAREAWDMAADLPLDSSLALHDVVFPRPAASTAERDAQDERLKSTEWAQPAIAACSLALLRLLQAVGLQPDMVAGHSLGELTALHAAGVFGDSDLLSMARRRGELMKSCSEKSAEAPGAMTAVVTSPSELERLLSERGDDVVLSNCNSPKQAVASGSTAGIERLEAELTARGIAFRRLNVANAFHSRFVAGAAARFEQCLGEVPFQHPQIPVASNVTAEFFPAEGAAARVLLAKQLASPVQFQRCIERLYADSARIFVEVGPGGHIARLVEQCLEGRESLVVALDRQGQHGVTQAWHALGRLAVAGVPLKWSALWEGFAAPSVSTAADPKHAVTLTGSQYGKPYPDVSGAAKASPRPEPERAVLAQRADVLSSPPPVPSATVQSSTVVSAASNSTVAPAFSQRLPPTPATYASIPSGNVSMSQSPNGSHRAPERIGLSNASHIERPISARAHEPPAAAPVPAPITTTTHTRQEHSASWWKVLEAIQHETATVQQDYLQAMSDSQQAYLRTVESSLSALTGRAVAEPFTTSADNDVMAVEATFLPAQSRLREDVAPTESDSRPIARAQPVAPPPTVTARTTAPTAFVAAPAFAAPPAVTRPPAEPAPAVKLDAILLAVVADKTGYPLDVLNLDMEIEADLGIDSIKRVEILSSLVDQVAGLSDVDAAAVGGLRSLRDVFELLDARHGQSAAASASPPAAGRRVDSSERFIESSGSKSAVVAVARNDVQVASVSPAAALDLEKILLQVVVEKTGYPLDVLNLSMEIEADLGIDSIKRVEILSALSERLPDLPEMDVADVGRLRTLRDVHDSIQDALGQGASRQAHAPDVQLQPTLDALPAEHPSETEVICQVVRIVESPPAGFIQPGLFRPERLVLIANAKPDRSWQVAEPLARLLQTRGVPADVASEVPEAVSRVIYLAPLGEVRNIDDALDSSCRGFQIARAVARSGVAGQQLFVTVQDTGGSFGFSNTPEDRAWLGGLPGLTKTAAREWPDASLKAIDLEVGQRSPEELAEVLFEELIAGGGEPEVGLRADGSRWTPRCFDESAVQQAAAQAAWLRPNMVVLASGGARGVTATALKALSTACQPRLILLGRTRLVAQEPDWSHGAADEATLKRRLLDETSRNHRDVALREVDRQVRDVLVQRELRESIRELERAGAQVRYLEVDVTDAAALITALAPIRNEWGPIDAVIHGAGVLADKRIADKTDEQFDRVFSTKVTGLRALLAATQHDPLTLICLFSSVAARYGNSGQCDYAMANEVLNKIAQAERRRRGDACLVKSLNWGPWDGGMVQAGLKAHFKELGVALIPPEQGAAAFVDALRGAAPSAVEVVVGARFSGHALQPFAPRASRVDVSVSLARYPFLDSHRINDVVVVPVVLVVEWFARAAQALHPDSVLSELRDVRVLKGIPLEDVHRDTSFSIVCSDTSQNGSILTRIELIGQTGTVHYACIAEMLPQRIGAHAVNVPADLSNREVWPWSIADAYERLFHGPDFQVLRSLDGLCRTGASATLGGTAEQCWTAGPWHVDAAAIDGALQLALLWGLHKTDRMSLPTRVGLYRPLGTLTGSSPIRCELRTRNVARHCHTFDILLTGADGTHLAELTDVEMALLAPHKGLSLR